MAGPRCERCDMCYFWQRFGDGEEDDGEVYSVGSCRRFPPTIPYEGDRKADPFCHAWTGANSKSTFWCGEFKLREAP